MRNSIALFGLLAAAAFAGTAKEFDNEAGISLGCGNPFGMGALEVWHQLSPTHELGAGIGVSWAGTNVGLGYKRYFRVEDKFNPWIGASAFYATGKDSTSVIVPKMTIAKYRLKSGFALQPRAGIRCQAGWLNLHFAAGWGFPLVGGGAEFEDVDLGLRSDKAADFFAIGGPELSMAAMFRF